MIHVTKTQSWNFEIPKSCRECPMRYSERDGNCTIEFCRLKNHKRWEKNTVSYKKVVLTDEGEKYKYKRDKHCPLKNGESYAI